MCSLFLIRVACFMATLFPYSLSMMQQVCAVYMYVHECSHGRVLQLVISSSVELAELYRVMEGQVNGVNWIYVSRELSHFSLCPAHTPTHPSHCTHLAAPPPSTPYLVNKRLDRNTHPHTHTHTHTHTPTQSSWSIHKPLANPIHIW